MPLELPVVAAKERALPGQDPRAEPEAGAGAGAGRGGPVRAGAECGPRSVLLLLLLHLCVFTVLGMLLFTGEKVPPLPAPARPCPRPPCGAPSVLLGPAEMEAQVRPPAQTRD